MPASNEKDLRDIPDEVRSQMKFTFVTNMEQVFAAALLPTPEPVLADARTEPDAPVDEEDNDLDRLPADVAAETEPQAQV